jgi:hypothetical protein
MIRTVPESPDSQGGFAWCVGRVGAIGHRVGGRGTADGLCGHHGVERRSGVPGCVGRIDEVLVGPGWT